MKGYFDHNATTPLHPTAREAMLVAWDQHWQNPSSLYREAAAARRALEAARERLGELIGAEPERIVLTSGATESNNALIAHVSQQAGAGARAVVSGLEHPSVREPLARHFGNGVQYMPTLTDTQPDLDAVASMVRELGVAFVSMMAASNECGTLLPVEVVADLCQAQEIPLHVDAAQWLGRYPAEHLGRCAYVTGSAHKFGGPKGVGFLVLRDEEEALGYLCGGPQEQRRRAGTENYPAIAGMLAALEASTVMAHSVGERETRAAWRDAFEQTLRSALPGTQVIAGETRRLWNTSMILLPRHDQRKWLARVNDLGFAISTGSACSAGQEGSCVVLEQMGLPLEARRRAVRVSSGWDTTEADWLALAAALIQTAADLDTQPLRRSPMKKAPPPWQRL